ncbi:MAG: tetratricopeptide repeat protein [Puniceicoccales bacterium]
MFQLLKLYCAILLLTGVTFARADNAEAGDQSIAALEKKVAANPDDIEARYDLGLAYNELAIHDDEAALERAIIVMRSILKDDPNYIKARAMLGSMTVMKAQYAPMMEKLDYVKEGYGMLDDIIAKHPDNADLRLIRGANAANSPGFLGRGDIATEDFDWLITDIKTHPDAYDNSYQRTIYFYAGDWFLSKRDKRAVPLLIKAQKLSGAPRLAPSIAESLKKARKVFPSTYRSYQSQ